MPESLYEDNESHYFYCRSFFANDESSHVSTTAKRDDYKIRVPPTFRSNPANRDGVYLVFANGIVRDTRMGLEWLAGPDKNTTWDEANSWVQSLDIDGGGWRMPTLDELESLYKKGTGLRNMTPHLKTRGWWVWSGELEGSAEARSFSFGHGYRGYIFRGNSCNERVFAVRSRSD